MEDLVKTSFQATKESCILTSLGYVFKYLANVQRMDAPSVEEVFETYIEYYRMTHENNGLSGSKLVDWAQKENKRFSKKYFKKESKEIETKYKSEFNYTHLNKGIKELLSTIMLHWVCQFENKELNQQNGKRGYDEIVDFWKHCKINDKYKVLLADVEIVDYKTSLNENYKSEVIKRLSSGDYIGMVLYPATTGSHSVFVYRDGDKYIVRDPNKKAIDVIDLQSMIIREYIIFQISNNKP